MSQFVEEFVSIQQVAAHTGATPARIDQWIRKGWVPAMDFPGSGNPRRHWPPEAVAVIRKLQRASEVKAMSLPELATYLDQG